MRARIEVNNRAQLALATLPQSATFAGIAGRRPSR
jgi:hypothetical protein